MSLTPVFGRKVALDGGGPRERKEACVSRIMVVRPGRRLVGVFEVDGTIRQNCEPGRIHSYRDDRSHVPVRDHDTVL